MIILCYQQYDMINMQLFRLLGDSAPAEVVSKVTFSSNPAHFADALTFLSEAKEGLLVITSQIFDPPVLGCHIGSQLASRIKLEHPGTPVVLYSSFFPVMREASNFDLFIEKGGGIESMRALVRLMTEWVTDGFKPPHQRVIAHTDLLRP